MLLVRKNLISVVNRSYQSISLGWSSEHILSNGIKISSWKIPRQTRSIAAKVAALHSYRLQTSMEITVIVRFVEDWPAATVGQKHILASFALRIKRQRQSRSWPLNKAGNAVQVQIVSILSNVFKAVFTWLASVEQNFATTAVTEAVEENVRGSDVRDIYLNVHRIIA